MRTLLGRSTAAALALLACLLFSTPPTQALPIYPAADPDPFYSAPPDLAGRGNGDVLRVRPVDVSRYGNADGWQVLFRSTNSSGTPIAATTTVMVPRGGVDRPLVSYQAIINSLGTQCGPSHTLFTGELQEAPALAPLLLRGWSVALPDHLGPTSAYGAAKLGGQIVLDGIRAVKRLPEMRLVRSPVGLVGYSGGGMATGWAAALAPSYAPELPIVGSAQGGVPADLSQMAAGLGGGPHPLFGLAFAATLGLEREYAGRMEVSPFLTPAGTALRDRIANACSEQIIADGAGHSTNEVAQYPDRVLAPPMRAVFDENSLLNYPGAPSVPVFAWHGADDVLAPVGATAATMRNWCARGTPVQLDVLPGDHGPAAIEGIPGAFGFLNARFAGAATPSNC
ncbi:Lipase [Rhodococcus sp. RD6.2]|uniref:lipase family protein n=1 Tax=Rhodococcus sp. RD6.2 TaxID=260936 RepID=UPI00063B87A4|nr:lipase family protein [Rhodococcus sp. RD6.2]CRK51568.1 Lipase [Rhodococcus sp. RD6.2]